MNLEEFKATFPHIRAMAWQRSMRRGPTGVGHTLEQLLGLTENNIAVPDLGNVELKAHRVNSPSMITLFTFNRKAWKVKPLEAVRRFGTKDANGRIGMYFTMSRTPNSTGLFLEIGIETVAVRHIEGTLIAQWSLEAIASRFMKKIPGLVFVTAVSEMRGNEEWFRYDRAQLLTGTSGEILRQQLDSGNVLLDLRLHDKITSARNHGTGFRSTESKLPNLFANIEEI